VAETRAVLARRESLTPADHQTHRRYVFRVPPDCVLLHIRVRYSPKFVSSAESAQLVARAIRSQSEGLAPRVGQALVELWERDFEGADLRVPNLLTISLDDALGAYRGAGHRHAPDQELTLGTDSASPGLVAGNLPSGDWTLTVSAHTLVSDQCEVDIQIGAEIASSRP
jgi:hypothetical protein